MADLREGEFLAFKRLIVRIQRRPRFRKVGTDTLGLSGARRDWP